MCKDLEQTLASPYKYLVFGLCDKINCDSDSPSIMGWLYCTPNVIEPHFEKKVCPFHDDVVLVAQMWKTTHD